MFCSFSVVIHCYTRLYLWRGEGAGERRSRLACCIRLEVASFSCCLDHAPPLQCFSVASLRFRPHRFFPPLKLLLHWRELGPFRSPFAAPARGRGSWARAAGVGGAVAGSGLASAAATREPSCSAARAHHCGGTGVWTPLLGAQPHHCRRRRRRCTGVWLLLPYFTLV